MKTKNLIIFISILLSTIIGFGILTTFFYFNISNLNNKPPIITQTENNYQNFEPNLTRIVASNYPSSILPSLIGEELVNIQILTPSGTDPHNFEPTPEDTAIATSADLFVFIGAGFDEWAKDLASTLVTENVRFFETSTGLELLKGEKHEHDEEHEEESDSDEEPSHNENDPHFWLDPVLMQTAASQAKEALVTIDSSNAQAYTENLEKLQAKFTDLDKKFTSGLANCKKDTIIVSHNAFSYLGTRYGIKIESISGLEPDQEPSPQALADLIALAQKKELGYVLYETQISQELAQTLAIEAGLDTLVLDSLEAPTLNNEKDYFSIMEENLSTLQTALECSN